MSKDVRSVCHWELTAQFRTRVQAEMFIGLMMSDEIVPSFTYTPNDVDGIYIIEVHDMAWANNLERIAALLVECDAES